ncbi:MAG: DUF3078 domain-containing protein [Paramuribaculum sp.]|nr:DUF3078 domain-containing protein [Paramuribaculum sp.]MDE6324393.1 DUF3078 domain-containing protein [Paramuribaculum sp.]
MSIKKLVIILLLVAIGPSVSMAQSFSGSNFLKKFCTHDSIDFVHLSSPPTAVDGLLIDNDDFDSLISTPERPYRSAILEFAAPAVFDRYELLDTVALRPVGHGYFNDAFQWLDDYETSFSILENARQNYVFSNPDRVMYNLADLPEPPKAYRAFVDPLTTNIVVEEIDVSTDESPIQLAADISYKKWLNSFDASLQFSQAYISPNWYQGGNNNLNLIGHAIYNIKLNQKFYPNVLFETTVQYKLALNSAPDDSIHAFNISEDLFQINSTFGLKAAKRWYYSANLLFKTQLLKSYPTNSRTVKSSFMSPGELNIGLGMTYNYESPKKNFAFGASISPLSWNLKTCMDSDLDPTAYGIDVGRHSVNTFGSSAELKAMWKVAYNIVYNTRLFCFTDYGKFQADWEHTIDFNINKFLSTRLFVNMRYDTQTPRPADSDKWHKFQLKEIFSFGFAYHFGV